MRRWWLILVSLLALSVAVQGQNCDTLETPFSETFDGYGTGASLMPPCWTATRNYDLGYPPHLMASPHGGSGSALVLYPGTLAESHYSMVIAPPVGGLASLDGIYLVMRILAPNTSARLVVGLCQDTGRYTRAFVPVDTLHVDQGNRWQEVVVDLGAYTGAGRRVALRMDRGLQADSSEFYIDNLRITGCGTTEPWASHLGSDRLTLHFESFGVGTVEVAYGDTLISPAVSPLVLSGLTPDSDYLFSIGCADGQHRLLGVRTMESAGIVAAYTERFDAVGGAMPAYWRRPMANQPRIDGGALLFTPVGDSSMAVLPRLAEGDVQQMMLAFNLGGSGTAAMVVGVMEYAAEPSSFVAIDTLWPADDAVGLTSLAPYGGEGKYVALMAVGSGTLRVDNLRLARCLADGLTPYNLTDEGITLVWDTLYLAPDATLSIEYGPVGFAPGSGTTLAATAPPMDIAGMAADTEYDLYLLGSCGDRPSEAERITFRTFAHEVQPPYCEGFEQGSTLPQGWVCASGSAAVTADALRGSHALRLDAATLALPLLGSEAGDTVLLDFYGYGTSPLVVGLADNPYAAVTPVDTLAAGADWVRQRIVLADAAGRCPVLTVAGRWTIDAIGLRRSAVADVSVSAIGLDQARISWQGPDSVRIEYKAVTSSAADFEPGSGVSLVAEADTLISGLQPGTNYRVHVDLADGGGADCSYLSFSFATLDPPLEVPWCANYDGDAVGTLPQGWRRLSDVGEYPIVSTERRHSGGRSLLLTADAARRTIAILPDATACSDARTVALWTNRLQSDATLEFGVMTDITDSTTFMPTDTLGLGPADQWRSHLLHIDSLGNRHMALRLGSTGGTVRLFIDDVCVENCAAYNLHAYNIDSTGFNLSWNARDSLALLCTVSSNGRTTNDTLYTSPARIEGLDSGTSYFVSITTLCGCGATGVSYSTGYSSNGPVPVRTYGFSINTRVSPAATPYCENFESLPTGSMPSYWRSRLATSTDQNSHGGDKCLRISAGGSIIMRQITDANQMRLSLHLYANNEAMMEDGAVVVGLMADPDSANTFTPTDTLQVTALGQWQHHVARLGTDADTGRYITLRVAAANGMLYVDDVVVARCAIDSAAVSASGIVTWSGADSVMVEYGPAGFARGSGTVDTAVQPYTLAGLEEGMAYDIYLKPICDGGSCQSMRLELGNVRLTPYCENFDAVPLQGMANGWTVGRTYKSTPAISTVGTRTLKMSGAAGNRSIAVMPDLAVDDIEAHELTLSLRTSKASRARLLVGTIAEGNDPNTFSAHDTLTVAESNTWQRLRLPLSHHSGGRIALACEASVQEADIWIDSIGITRGLWPSVHAVSARRVSILGTGGYYVDYATVDIPQGEGTQRHIADSAYDIGGMSPGASYRFYFAADSGGTCLEPIVVTMPTEVALPYCYGNDTAAAIILPEPAADSLGTLHLYYSQRGASPIEVGVMTQRGDWSTFTPIDTTASTTTAWTAQHVSIASYTGSGRFIALRTTDGSNTLVDGLMLSRCELPAVELTIENKLIVSGSGTIEYGLAGTPQGEGIVVQAPDTVSLADSTDYDIFRRCADESNTCADPIRVETYIDHCPLPDSLLVAQPGSGIVELRWDSAFSDFYIEYALSGSAQGSGTTVRADAQPLTLMLAPDTLYDLYVRCDSLQTTTRVPQRLRTLAAMTGVPYCNTFDDGMAGWRVMQYNQDGVVSVEDGHLSVSNYYGVTYLVLPQPDVDSLRRLNVTLRARFHESNGHTLTLGTMSDAADTDTFDPLASFTSMGGGYTRCFHSLANYYGNGRFLALRLRDDDILDIDEISLGICAAYGFSMTEMESDHVVFEWQQTGNPDITIEYGEQGFAAGSGTIVHPTVSPCRIDGLSPLTNYAFYVGSQCSEACDSAFIEPQASLRDTFFTFTPQGGTGCIDYTDLRASYVTCSYGSYLNPMASQGAVDYGYLSAQSRHTVHFDTNERDARTQGLLRTIPEGEHASVRLGNWASGGNASPQAESITYGMTVDAEDADLLLLRYAAVLQDPEHAPSLQPRFRMEILNQQGQLIDSCSMADFIANAALGWNQAPNEVLWKDWTTVGVDLTAYNGQTIFVRLTTNDCGEGSHFGYAYFTLRCAHKRMLTEGCSDVPSNRFTVPDGFVYRWWSSADSTQVISDSASILVPSDNSVTYYCRLSFVDNPGCAFTMSAFAGARYPLALFDTAMSVADCQFDVSFYNRSTISMDGITPVGTDEACESFRWLMPDGSESTAAVPAIHLDDTGSITLSLIAGIANDQCLDTLTRTIDVRHPHHYASLDGPTERCANWEADTVRAQYAYSCIWGDGSADQSAVLAPTTDTVLTCYTVDYNGCRDTLTHLLAVHNTTLQTYSDTLCSSALSYAWLDTVVTFLRTDDIATARLDRLDRYGCDSTMTLSLSLWPSYAPQLYDTICDDEVRPFYDTLLAATGSYLYHDSTMHGCDSAVSLHLSVMPRRWSDDVRQVCDSLRWTDGRLYTADTTGPTDTMYTVFGCDSVVSLHLTVNYAAHGNTTDIACASSDYTWRGHTIAADTTLREVTLTTVTDTFSTVAGCDSILSLSLTLMPMLHADIRLEYLCADTMYRLVALTDAPHWYWASSTHAIDGRDYIDIRPSKQTLYTLTADYGTPPLCAVGSTLMLDPYDMPEAKLRVAPQLLSPENLDFEARDVGRFYGERAWYYKGELLSSTERAVQLSAEPADDTVGVALVVGDSHCYDTALVLIPVESSALRAPNVFTPDADENRTFRVAKFHIAQFEIRIYNRRGMLVYKSADRDFEWDGRALDGTPCQEGAYVYHIIYTTTFRPTEKHKEVGTVLLLR